MPDQRLLRPGRHPVRIPLRSERLTPLMEGILFRICQEALTNATKHSQAKQIRVRLTQEHAWYDWKWSTRGSASIPNRPRPPTPSACTAFASRHGCWADTP